MAKKQLKPTDLEKQFNKEIDILNGYLKELKAKKNLSEQQLYVFLREKSQDYRFKSAMFTVHNIETTLGSNCPSIEDYELIKDELDELKKTFGSYIGFRQYFDGTASSDYDSSDASIEEIFVTTRYIELNEESNSKIKTIAADLAKDWLAAQLATITGKTISRYNLDCKIIELWKTDKIDFDTFCTIISTNCKI